jgi:hypothetical protein
MGKASRRRRRYAYTDHYPSLEQSLLSQPPPRDATRIFPARKMLKRSEALLLAFSFMITSILVAGPIFLRMAALAFGKEAIGHPDSLGAVKTLKGRTWTVFEVSFVTANGLVRKSYPVGLGGARRFAKDHPAIGVVKVAYIPSAPWISGLVNDFGYSRIMVILLISTFGGLGALIVVSHLIVVFWREPRQKRLVTHGIALPFDTQASFFRSTRISYCFEGRTYIRRLFIKKVAVENRSAAYP